MKSRREINELELAQAAAFALTHLYFADELRVGAIHDGIRNIDRGWRPDLIPKNPRGYRHLLRLTRWRDLVKVVREHRRRQRHSHSSQSSRAARWADRDAVENLIALLRTQTISPEKWPPANVWALVIFNAMAIDDRPMVLRAYAEFRGSLPTTAFRKLEARLATAQRSATAAASVKRSRRRKGREARIRKFDRELAAAGMPKQNRASRIAQKLDVDPSTVRRALRKPRK